MARAQLGRHGCADLCLGAAEATAAVLGLLAVARELSFMSFLLGFTACVVAAVGAWVSIALKRPLIGIELEQRSPQVS